MKLIEWVFDQILTETETYCKETQRKTLYKMKTIVRELVE